MRGGGTNLVKEGQGSDGPRKAGSSFVRVALGPGNAHRSMFPGKALKLLLFLLSASALSL